MIQLSALSLLLNEFLRFDGLTSSPRPSFVVDIHEHAWSRLNREDLVFEDGAKCSDFDVCVQIKRVVAIGGAINSVEMVESRINAMSACVGRRSVYFRTK